MMTMTTIMGEGFEGGFDVHRHVTESSGILHKINRKELKGNRKAGESFLLRCHFELQRG